MIPAYSVSIRWKYCSSSSSSSSAWFHHEVRYRRSVSVVTNVYKSFSHAAVIPTCRRHLYVAFTVVRLVITVKVKVKFSHTCYPVLGPELIQVYRQSTSLQVALSHPPSCMLPLLSVRPAVTFPSVERHRLLASTKLYCLVTEAHRCEQLAQGCYTRQRSGHGLNLRPLSRQSDGLSTRLSNHP